MITSQGTGGGEAASPSTTTETLMRYETRTEWYARQDERDGWPRYGADPVNDEDRGANDEGWS